jgi:hypothetical protein
MAYDYTKVMEAINRKKFSALPDLGVERTPKPEKRTLVGSTLPAPSKPIAPKGKRGKRLEKGDKAARKAVFELAATCEVCELAGAPDKQTRTGNDEWAHVHGRVTHKGGGERWSENRRQDPRYQCRLCPTHHDWHHGKGNHSLGIRVTVLETKHKHHFTVDGINEYTKEFTKV